MAGVNNIVTSMIPLALKDRMNSGRIAGIINGFCYLGSTASTYGLGLIADNYTWLSVFYVLAGACALAASAGFIYALISKVIKQKANGKIS
jgi:sugar phosphate permease